MDSHELDAKIASLEDTLREPLFGGPRRDGQFWRGVWNQIRDVGQGFRATRYPTKAAKDAAWARYSSIVDGVKSQQEEYHARRKSREEESERLLSKILGKAQAAWPHEDGFIEFLGLISGATILAEVIIGTMEVMVDVLTLGLLRTEERDPQKAKLMACSEEMKRAWELFKTYRQELLPHHRDAARKALTGVQGELDKEWTAWKAEKQGRRDEWNRRIAENRIAKEELLEEARALLGSHRDPASRRRAKELFEEWRAVKSAGRQDDERLWQRFRGALDEFWSESKNDQRRHILGQISKVEAMIEQAKANREANEERLASSRSDDYADRVREWIEQDDANIEKFEGWLEEWQEKLCRLDD